MATLATILQQHHTGMDTGMATAMPKLSMAKAWQRHGNYVARAWKALQIHATGK
jgi:hypothetical protein